MSFHETFERVRTSGDIRLAVHSRLESSLRGTVPPAIVKIDMDIIPTIPGRLVIEILFAGRNICKWAIAIYASTGDLAPLVDSSIFTSITFTALWHLDYVYPEAKS